MVDRSTRTAILFFFFQAEDGIRDYKVTGVQTCALPIWHGQRRPTHSMAARIHAPATGTVGDRKSTRLNSSHLVISYAVFCLKKKKKRNIYLSEGSLTIAYCRAAYTWTPTIGLDLFAVRA